METEGIEPSSVKNSLKTTTSLADILYFLLILPIRRIIKSKTLFFSFNLKPSTKRFIRLVYALKVRSDVKSWDTSLSKSQSRSITLFVSLCFLTPFVRVIVKLGLQFLKNFYVETGRPHILMPLDLYVFQYFFQFPFNVFLLNRFFLLEFTLGFG